MRDPDGQDCAVAGTIVELERGQDARIDAVARLLVDAFPEAWPTMEEAMAEVNESFGSGFISRVAIAEDGSVLGWIGGRSEYDGVAWELHPLVVHPARRRQGIGRMLVTDLEARVRERGAITLYLGTDDDRDQTSLSGQDLYPEVLERLQRIENRRGHPYEFYQRLGFVVVGAIPDANGFGKPDILMAKRVGVV